MNPVRFAVRSGLSPGLFLCYIYTMKEITIAGRKIGEGHPCFVVAEVSCNHRQKYDEAVKIIEAAGAAGADAVKLQTYTPDTMTLDSDKKWFYVGGEDTPDSWKKETLYQIYQKAYTPWDWQPKLKKLANDLGMILFSTPFDATAVDFLEEMGVPCYKVASYEATDIPLLKKIAATAKPVIMSIGFATLEEADLAVKTLKENGTKELAVLHCVTTYSDKPQAKNMNLSTIADIKKRWEVVAGFSDNNYGIEFPIAAAQAGASIIEKHLVTKHNQGSFDDRFSIDPGEFKEMVKRIREVKELLTDKILLGKPQYGPVSKDEENYRRLRRSIFVAKDIKRGEKFTKENIRVIRPESGLAPKHYEEVLGKSASADIEKATPLTRDLIAANSEGGGSETALV